MQKSIVMNNKDESANCLFLTQIVFPELSRTRITGEMILSWVKSNVIKGRGEILKGQGFSNAEMLKLML